VKNEVAVTVADAGAHERKVADDASSSTYSRPPKMRVSFFGDATATLPPEP